MTSGLVLVGAAALAMPSIGRAALIVQYNFGSVSTSGESLATMEMPTASSPNVTTNSLTVGSTTNTATDEGTTGSPAPSTYYTSPSQNYLSVNNSSASSDIGYYVDFIVTANAGYELTPTGFTLVGGAGGSSNARSWLLYDNYDNVDGFPSAIAANTASTLPATDPPTPTGGDELASGTFTALRSTGAAMNSFTTTSFTAADQNLASLDIRVFFDTQLNGQTKNIDLGSLELDGSVVAVPEPATFALIAVAAVGGLYRRRRVLAGQ